MFDSVNLEQRKLLSLDNVSTGEFIKRMCSENISEFGENQSFLPETKSSTNCGGQLSYSYLVWIHPHLFVVGCSCLLSRLFLALRAPPKEDIIYKCILQQSQEDKDEAAHEVHVYGLDIGDFGEGFSQVGVNGSHGEHRGNTWWRKAMFFI